jgi:hypothetical protein
VKLKLQIYPGGLHLPFNNAYDDEVIDHNDDDEEEEKPQSKQQKFLMHYCLKLVLQNRRFE